MEKPSERTHKICGSCRENRPLLHYNKANRRDGFRSWCKFCERLLRRTKEQEARSACIKKLGSKCVHCGYTDFRALQIDHVNGGGNKEHKELSNAFKFYQKVLADTSGTYQLLCANCNWVKRYERLENAHEDRKYSPEGLEAIRKARAAGKYISDETREKLSRSSSRQREDTGWKAKIGAGSKASWADPVIRAKRIDGMRKTFAARKLAKENPS